MTARSKCTARTAKQAPDGAEHHADQHGQQERRRRTEDEGRDELRGGEEHGTRMPMEGASSQAATPADEATLGHDRHQRRYSTGAEVGRLRDEEWQEPQPRHALTRHLADRPSQRTARGRAGWEPHLS